MNSSANSEDNKKTFLEDLNTILDITDCGDSIGSLNGVIVYFNKELTLKKFELRTERPTKKNPTHLVGFFIIYYFVL